MSQSASAGGAASGSGGAGLDKIDANRFYPKQAEAPIETPDTVKLISADGFEFIIDRRAAMKSGTIKNMLSSPGTISCSLLQ